MKKSFSILEMLVSLTILLIVGLFAVKITNSAFLMTTKTNQLYNETKISSKLSFYTHDFKDSIVVNVKDNFTLFLLKPEKDINGDLAFPLRPRVDLNNNVIWTVLFIEDKFMNYIYSNCQYEKNSQLLNDRLDFSSYTTGDRVERSLYIAEVFGNNYSSSNWKSIPSFNPKDIYSNSNIYAIKNNSRTYPIDIVGKDVILDWFAMSGIDLNLQKQMRLNWYVKSGFGFTKNNKSVNIVIDVKDISSTYSNVSDNSNSYRVESIFTFQDNCILN